MTSVKNDAVFGGLAIAGGVQPLMAPTNEGPPGNAGWTPVLAGLADGTRTLIKVADWTGGQGAKPAAGMYIGETGYVSAKADAFNFNAAKRVSVISATTNASGIATLAYSGLSFANVPVIVALPATGSVITGATRSTVQASPAPTATSAQIKVEQLSLLSGVFAALLGATANALLIEN